MNITTFWDEVFTAVSEELSPTYSGYKSTKMLRLTAQ
jgi:hypothetical protein